MLLGNYTVTNKCPVNFLAGSGASTETGGRASVQRNGAERCRFYISENTAAISTWAEPSANYPPTSYTIIPQKGGWLSSRRETWATLTATGDALSGMPGVGTATITITTNEPSGGMITSGQCTASFAITSTPPLLTASINGAGETSFSVSTNVPVLGAEASLEGAASFAITVAPAARLPLSDASPLRTGTASFAVTGALVPYATGSMAGSTQDLTGMTPITVAQAVWAAVANEFNDAGTMGQKINAAGTAGDPWTADLSAYASGTAGYALGNVVGMDVEIHPGITLERALQALLAVAAGKASGGGSGEIVFRDVPDTRNAVRMTVDANGNRTAVTVS